MCYDLNFDIARQIDQILLLWQRDCCEIEIITATNIVLVFLSVNYVSTLYRDRTDILWLRTICPTVRLTEQNEWSRIRTYNVRRRRSYGPLHYQFCASTLIIIIVTIHKNHILSYFTIVDVVGLEPTSSLLKRQAPEPLGYTSMSASDGYCPHMLSIKSRVYYLSTTGANICYSAFVSVFVSLCYLLSSEYGTRTHMSCTR